MILLYVLWVWHQDCKMYGGNDKLAAPLRERLKAYLLVVVVPVLLGLLLRK